MLRDRSPACRGHSQGVRVRHDLNRRLPTGEFRTMSETTINPNRALGEKSDCSNDFTCSGRAQECQFNTLVSPSCLSALSRRNSCLGQIACFRSEEHTSELQSLLSNSSAVFCLKK